MKIWLPLLIYFCCWLYIGIMPKTILTLETHKQRKKESIEYVCFITKCSKILQINQYLSKNDQILKLCDFLIQLFPKTFDLYVTIYNYFASLVCNIMFNGASLFVTPTACLYRMQVCAVGLTADSKTYAQFDRTPPSSRFVVSMQLCQLHKNGFQTAI